jgi:DegV family protein with EDD domain
MSRIAVITDTDSSLPLELANRLGIRQVPIGIHFNDEEQDAVFQIDDRQLFEKIDRLGKLPTTSAPSTGKWAEAFKQAFNDGADEVICFCVSAAVSGTYGSAVAAVEFVPGGTITVVDTQSLAIAQGFMVLEAAKAAAEGAASAEILKRAFSVQKRTMLYGALATLKYLAMSGRVGHLAAGFANLLDVKPILTIRDGKLDMLEKVRTQKKAWQRMIELAKSTLNGRAIAEMAILHVAAEDTAHEFEQLLRKEVDCPQDFILSSLTPGLSVHTGTGLVGISFVAAE